MKKSGIGFKDKGIKKRFKQIQEWVNKVCPEYMEKLGDRIRVSIKERVQMEGMGLKKKMKKYSPEYKKWRKKKGRQVSFRDLTVSGRMLNALSLFTGVEGEAKIFFKGKGEQEKASGNQKRAAFFGIGKREKKVVKSAMKELIGKAL